MRSQINVQQWNNSHDSSSTIEYRLKQKLESFEKYPNDIVLHCHGNCLHCWTLFCDLMWTWNENYLKCWANWLVLNKYLNSVGWWKVFTRTSPQTTTRTLAPRFTIALWFSEMGIFQYRALSMFLGRLGFKLVSRIASRLLQAQFQDLLWQPYCLLKSTDYKAYSYFNPGQILTSTDIAP